MYTRRTLRVALHFGQLTTTRWAGAEAGDDVSDTGSIGASVTGALAALTGTSLLDVFMIAWARGDHTNMIQSGRL